MSEPVLLAGGGLQIRFQFCGDRFVHTIAAVDGGKGGERIVPLAASHEGTPQEQWPASPAIQEINQMPGENQIAMLMGQTVQGYWSVTVELDDVAARAVFDVACRVKSPPPSRVASLGSGYRTVVTPCETVAGGVRLELGEAVVEVETDEHDASAEAGGQLVVDDEGFRVIPRDLPSEFPETVRWRYAVHRLK